MQKQQTAAGSQPNPPEPDFGAHADYVVKDPELFARNMARMLEQLGKAASAWVAPRESGAIVDAPDLGMGEMVQTFSKVGEYWLSDPARALEAQTRLFGGFMGVWTNSILRMSGETTTTPVPSAVRDKRFQDPDWSRNLFFDFLRQTYGIVAEWSEGLVTRAEGLDPHTRHKATFYVRQVMNALSPTNFVLTNPEVYRETMASNGENLVRGMRMLAEDLAAGRGNLKLRQSDESRFQVGRDMALTPGKVVAQNDMCQIVQYAPQTKDVLKRPLLISPPWINKFYILDLNPEKSFIRWMVDQGHTVFVISWVNPDERHADLDWQDYIEQGIRFGLDTVEAATGEREVNTVGYCVGGTLLGAALGYLKAKGDERIASATLLTTQIDFTHAGDLKVFVDENQLRTLEQSMEPRGYLEGHAMATAFNLLRSGELIWPYFVNNYLKGKEPLPFDLLYWNADSTRMAKANHLFYLRNCYLENNLSQKRMRLGDRRIDLSEVTIPVYNLATKEDHIAPARSVYVGSSAFGAPVTYVLSGSGHIAGVVNPPAKKKYQFWTGPAPSPDLPFEEWTARATETPGSWWPHWQAWIESLSAERVKPRRPGGGKLKPLEDAPGSYVRIKA